MRRRAIVLLDMRAADFRACLPDILLVKTKFACDADDLIEQTNAYGAVVAR
jgi:hypothetical protein